MFSLPDFAFTDLISIRHVDAAIRGEHAPPTTLATANTVTGNPIVRYTNLPRYSLTRFAIS